MECPFVPACGPTLDPSAVSSQVHRSRYFLRSGRADVRDAQKPAVPAGPKTPATCEPSTPASPGGRGGSGTLEARPRPRRKATVSPYFGPRPAKVDNANLHHPNLPPHLAVHPCFVHGPDQFGLVQELLAHDTWALLIATCLLNKTRGQAARPMCWEILRLWPTPEHLAKADEAALGQLLLPLGLFRQRAKRLRLFSQQFVDSPPCSDVLYAPRDRQAAYLGPTPVGHLAGVGRYALESWVIFCGGPDAWKRVRPSDKELKKYLEWRWSKEADRQADLAERVEPQSPLVGRS